MSHPDKSHLNEKGACYFILFRSMRSCLSEVSKCPCPVTSAKHTSIVSQIAYLCNILNCYCVLILTRFLIAISVRMSLFCIQMFWIFQMT